MAHFLFSIFSETIQEVTNKFCTEKRKQDIIILNPTNKINDGVGINLVSFKNLAKSNIRLKQFLLSSAEICSSLSFNIIHNVDHLKSLIKMHLV